MKLDAIEKKVEKLLASDKRWPVIVDFQNKNDMEEFIYHFNVGNNIFRSAGTYCGNDGTLKYEVLSNDIDNNSGNLFIANLSTYLKFCGESSLIKIAKSILSKSIDGHVILVTYQCKNYFKFSDTRYSERGQILVADGEPDENAKIFLVSPELATVFTGAYEGFEKIGEAYETTKAQIIHVATNVNKQIFDMSLINITQLSNGYDILCSKDSRIKNVSESLGTLSQWNVLLKAVGNSDLSTVIEEQFNSVSDLSECLKKYAGYSEEKRWIYYICSLVIGLKKNTYSSLVIENAKDYKDIPKSVFRSILSVNVEDENFINLYKERKELLKYFSQYLNETVDFCKVVSTKMQKAIYYLTDVTQLEKEAIIEWLGIYGKEYKTEQLIEILTPIYTDLAAYLSQYRFNNDLLNNYFESYKYQKLINTVLPSFKEIVDEQSVKLDFVSILKPRTQVFDKINLSGSHAYFIDALGVEYLGYIQSKCNEYGLSAKITCARSELPSLTCFNKEFLQVCKDRGCSVSDIKDLDEIKHHGEESFDYEKTKTPIYLIRELEIIDGVISKIQANIFNDKYQKAVIVSDHGASRLAVLNETENLWKMETDGVHSGRCCPTNEINEKPDFAIEESDFWILANYDRFKGGRKANVEVHGGATLEEVTIPIIEITKKSDEIESFILDDCKVITLAALEVPKLKIYVGTNSDSVTIKIKDRFYDAVKTNDNYIYEVELPDCTKKGMYSVDILNGSDVLSVNNSFEIKKKGFSEVSLFD